MDKTTVELIVETHGMVTANTAKVNSMYSALHGNGQPGLIREFEQVKQNQANCIARQKQTAEQKHWGVMELIAGVSMFTAIVLVIIDFIR